MDKTTISEIDILTESCRVCLQCSTNTFTSLQMNHQTQQGFPSLICAMCLDQLISAYEFQLKCIKSDRDIRMALGHVGAADPGKDKNEQIIKDEKSLNIGLLDKQNQINFIGLPSEYIDIPNEELTIDFDNNNLLKTDDICTAAPQDDSVPIILRCPQKLTNKIIVRKEFTCTICTTALPTINELRKHRKDHILSKLHQCTMCEKTFSVYRRLIEHIVDIHKCIKPYICSACNKDYTSLSALHKHNRRHTGETSYLCAECGKSFHDHNNLKQHVMRAHTTNKPFECDYCHKRFLSKADIKRHLLTHLEDKPHYCDICGSTFTQESSLKKHKLIHTGERPFACKVCNMSFNTAGKVVKHMRSHTGEKPYKCDLCCRAFANKSDLINHSRLHTGERPFACHLCDKRFVTSSSLLVHIRRHTGEKRYKCEFCNSAFVEKGCLRKHTRRLHTGNINLYRCHECPLEFRLQSELRQHNLEHYFQNEKVI